MGIAGRPAVRREDLVAETVREFQTRVKFLGVVTAFCNDPKAPIFSVFGLHTPWAPRPVRFKCRLNECLQLIDQCVAYVLRLSHD
jgi:hypothetical protein